MKPAEININPFYTPQFGDSSFVSRTSLAFLYHHFTSLGIHSYKMLSHQYRCLNTLEGEIVRMNAIAAKNLTEKTKIENDLSEVESVGQTSQLQGRLNKLSQDTPKSDLIVASISLFDRAVIFLSGFLTLGLCSLYLSRLLDKRISVLQNQANISQKGMQPDLGALQQQIDKVKGLIGQKHLKDLDDKKKSNDIFIMHYEKSRKEYENSLSKLQGDVNEITQYVIQHDGWESEYNKLKATKEQIGQYIPLSTQTIGIPSRYQRQKDDLNVPGAPGINEKMDEKHGVDVTKESCRYAKCVNGKKSALELMLAFFNDVYYEYLYELNMSKKLDKAFYEYMAYLLVSNAALINADKDSDDCSGPYLSLNDDNVRMYPTNPKRVVTKKYDPDKQCAVIATKIVPTRFDGFTVPKILDETFHGIDPVGLKWMLARMSDGEKRILFNLILDHEGKDQELVEWLKDEESEAVKRVKLAKEMITEIGEVIEWRFGPQLGNKWDDMPHYEGKYIDGQYFGKGKHNYPNGVYEGQFVNGRKQGKGLYLLNFTMHVHDKYEGGFHNDLFHGKGKLTIGDNGNLGSYEGDFFEGFPHGLLTYSHSSGEKYTGNYFKGEKRGSGVHSWGKHKYVGEMQHDEYHGKGKFFYDNGTIYVGEFYEGEFHGLGRLTYQSGVKYEGQFSKDKVHGQGTIYWPSGLKYPGQFTNIPCDDDSWTHSYALTEVLIDAALTEIYKE